MLRPAEMGWVTGNFLFSVHPMLVWLERLGYNVSYATSDDLHNGSLNLTSYKALLSVGHDEYWSFEMRQALEDAIVRGDLCRVFWGQPNILAGSIWRLLIGTWSAPSLFRL